MTNQVTSIEQSKRLLELGVPAEMASMVWDTISLASHPILREWDTSTDTKRWQVDRVGHVPAFTVADLLGALPSHCRMPDGAWINMEIGNGRTSGASRTTRWPPEAMRYCVAAQEGNTTYRYSRHSLSTCCTERSSGFYQKSAN